MVASLRAAGWFWGAAVLGLLFLVAGMIDTVNLAVDDVFISFRYAENLVHGLGLVFNPGERVEGYSNPLWTLLLALYARLGFTQHASALALLVAAKLTGAAFGLGTYAVLAAYLGWTVVPAQFPPSRMNPAAPRDTLGDGCRR